jgi:hypothetical protein
MRFYQQSINNQGQNQQSHIFLPFGDRLSEPPGPESLRYLLKLADFLLIGGPFERL